MAFIPSNMIRWSANSATISNIITPNPANPPSLLPTWYGYNSGKDTIATVSAAGYFTPFADFISPSSQNVLSVGDMIYCVCSNGNVTLTIATVGASITTVVASASANSVNTAAIDDLAVTTAKIADANVTLGKLAAGITPSHVIKYAAKYTTVGGAAAEAIVLAGALATDLAFVELEAGGSSSRTVSKAVMTNNTLTVTFSGDPGNDAVIYYQVIRAAA